MPNNVTLPGTGSVVEAVEVGGALRQVVQVANLPATQPVTVDVLPLPGGAATETTIAALLTAANAIKAAAETLAGRTINTSSIGGTVAVSNFPAAEPITGTVAVSNMVAQGLTDTQLRAAAVPVTVENMSAGLTDAQLRAAPVPVAVAIVKNTDTPFSNGDPGLLMLAKRRDSDTTSVSADGDYTTLNMDETGRLKVSTLPGSTSPATGSITASAQTLFINTERASNLIVTMVATTLVGHNATFEYSNNSTNGTDGNWYGVQVVRSNANTVETATGVLAATPVYGWEASVNGYKWFRVRATAHTSGTASYILQPGAYATEPIPAVQVTATQPVSGTVALGAAVARAGFLAHDGIWFDDSATVLAAAATFTGASRDLTVTATATAFRNAATYAAEVRVSGESDQAGTLWLEVSRDNTNWRRVKSVPTAAVTGGGQYAEIVHRPSWRYVRVGFTNGATLQTRFALGSFLMGA